MKNDGFAEFAQDLTRAALEADSAWVAASNLAVLRKIVKADRSLAGWHMTRDLLDIQEKYPTGPARRAANAVWDLLPKPAAA